MGSKPSFLGVYIAPGVFIGSDLALYRAYLAHVRAMAKPKTGEAHQIVRAWVMVQWRLQCLAELERDWWVSFEQGILLTEPAGEESVLDTDPLERMQVCQRAVNSWDKLQRMERRLKREAAALLPLLGALIAEAMVSENTQADPVADDEGFNLVSPITLADASGAISDHSVAVGESPSMAGIELTPDAILCASVAVGESSSMASVNCAPQAIAIHPADHLGFSSNRTDTQVQDAILTRGFPKGASSPLGGSVRAGALTKTSSDSVLNSG